MTRTFQSILDGLQSYWVKQGCVFLPAYPAEVGAATLHPATVFNCCGNLVPDLRIAYVQPCVRPADNRGSASRNRLYQHHQLQVLIKPVPDNIQDMYLDSIRSIGVDTEEHDIRFIEDNWENPSIGAYGLGWEVQWNGMEITQFTYMQQVGGVPCPVTPVELAYGLERIAMLIQNKESIFDIVWGEDGVTYGDFFGASEDQFAASLAKGAGDEALRDEFIGAESLASKYLDMNLPLVAFRYALKASHTFNVMDAKGLLGYNDRASMLLRMKDLVRNSCEMWTKNTKLV